jgi:hypothetical protein
VGTKLTPSGSLSDTAQRCTPKHNERGILLSHIMGSCIVEHSCIYFSIWPSCLDIVQLLTLVTCTRIVTLQSVLVVFCHCGVLFDCYISLSSFSLAVRLLARTGIRHFCIRVDIASNIFLFSSNFVSISRKLASWLPRYQIDVICKCAITQVDAHRAR